MILLWSVLVFASPQMDFDAGVQALRTEDSVNAENSFLTALEAGGIDADVYHGLGNALYRQGKLGEAVAAWQRGIMLEPQHVDLNHNLLQFRGKHSEEYTPFSMRLLSVAQQYMILSILFGVTLALGLSWPRRKFLWGTGLGLFICGSGWVGLTPQAHADAILVLPTVLATSMPEGAGVELFSLNSGVDVQILEESTGSYRIGISDGQRGWIPKQSLIMTDPDSPFMIQ